jgi:glycosyltransferase involved in cell wall biosynthesis
VPAGGRSQAAACPTRPRTGACRARSRPAPRIALLGAFQFPVPQGSQVFAAEQARALGRAGAEVTLVCYGRGAGAAPADLALVRTPARLSPRSHRAGPRAGKPVADAALLAALVRAQRARLFDAVLAHNAEAALVAIAARAITRVPVVYVAHTLLECELATYGPRALGRSLDQVGRRLDRAIAARADAVVALTRRGAERLSASAHRPVAVIPPGLDPRPAPKSEAIARTCARHGLEPGRYVLYAGNLDAYQELPSLAAAAAARPDVAFVAATHGAARDLGAVRVVRVEDVTELRRLTWAAGVAVAPRRAFGGFPVKLLNYMEAARPIVARSGVVDALVHDQNAWLVPPEAGPEAIAEACLALLSKPAHAASLGRAARSTLEADHSWPRLATQTLGWLAETVLRS